MISNRYAVADNPKISEYASTTPSSWLQYLDANNLFGWAMMQPLPERNFMFLSDEEITVFDIDLLRIENEKGCILEVYFEYPSELHDLHNDYPLAPKRLRVNKEMISEYGSHLAEKLGVKFPNIKKLIPNFYGK